MSAATQSSNSQNQGQPVEHVFGAIEQMKGKAIRTIWPVQSELCDDYDGYLLQSQAIGLLPKGWN